VVTTQDTNSGNNPSPTHENRNVQGPSFAEQIAILQLQVQVEEARKANLELQRAIPANQAQRVPSEMGVSTKGPKIQPPAQWNGSIKERNTFLRALHQYQDICCRGQTDQWRIVFVGQSLLTGAARDWYTSRLSEHSADLVWESYPRFIQELQAYFHDANEKQENMKRLANLQPTAKDASSYCIMFDGLIANTFKDLDQWKSYFFKNGLHADLGLEMSIVQGERQDLSLAENKAISLQGAAALRNRDKTSPVKRPFEGRKDHPAASPTKRTTQRDGPNCKFCNRGNHQEADCWDKFPEKRPARPQVSGQRNGPNVPRNSN
jgi:hypothetical protein